MNSEQKILLSFIVPVYNAETYLPSCIDSLVRVESKNIEIILVDDGSTDQSGHICDTYAQKDSRIQVIHQHNSGVASARNAGMEKALGIYIFFIDNDDWIDSSNIIRLLNILDTKHPDLVINRSFAVQTNGTKNKNDFFIKEEINGKNPEEVINYFRTQKVKIGAPWQYVFKKEIAAKNNIIFQTDQNGVDDSYFSAMLFLNCTSFYLNEDRIYFWRQRADSQGKTHKKQAYIFKMISSIESMAKSLDNLKEPYKKNFMYFNIYKNIYSLLGPYYQYTKEDRKALRAWYHENKDLIVLSSHHGGMTHRVLHIVFGNFYGTLVGYALARMKSRFIRLRQKI